MKYKQVYEASREYVEDNPLAQVIMWLGLLASGTLLLVVALNNLKPYVDAMGLIKVDLGFLINNGWGWVAGLILSIGLILKYLASVLVYSFTQLIETLWLIAFCDAKLQSAVGKKSRRLAAEAAQDGGTTKEIRRAAAVPYKILRLAIPLALAGYAFDLALAMRTYPIFKGWDEFWLFTKGGNPMWVNGDNLLQTCVMMFSFEIAAIPFICMVAWWKLREEF